MLLLVMLDHGVDVGGWPMVPGKQHVVFEGKKKEHIAGSPQPSPAG